MDNINNLFFYKSEKFLNFFTHFFGMILSIVGLVLLIVKASETHLLINILGVTVFGCSLILMYASSSFYHINNSFFWNNILRKIDHCNIFILISGTYTPIALIPLNGLYGWIIFGILWACSTIGLLSKLVFFSDGWTSTLLYIFMGWIALGFIVQIVSVLDINCIFLIILGGLFYTSGTFFYMLDESIKFFHAIWHIFVILGSITHFFAIYFYVAVM